MRLLVTGAGKADVVASNSLRAAITGAGKVTYAKPSALPEGKFDDVIYFGSDAAVCGPSSRAAIRPARSITNVVGMPMIR